MPTLPIEGYDTTREDGVTRIRPVYAAPLPVEAVSVQGQGLLPQETPALPVELPVAQPSGILAEADRALSGAVRAPFDALDERLFGKSGKKGTYREAIQKFFKTGPSDEVKTGVNRLLGTGGEERYKTWPEKLVVDAVTAPGNVLASETPVTTEELIKPALDVSNLAGTGGLAGAGSGAGVALGSGPIRQAATAAMTKSEKPFYSALERSLGSINQNKASGEQWLGMLANKGGVKPDELQWSGIGEFLAGKPSVTKAEIDSFLKDNPFGVQEVVKGADIPTKYHDYQLPGGENYRELLMTLPEKKFSRTDPRVMEEAKLAYKEKDIPRLSDDQWRMLQARAAKRNGDKLDEVYRSSHWDEPNILAHMRMNDRTIDGKKSLHLEEIQSDWHQAGRSVRSKEIKRLTDNGMSKEDATKSVNENFGYKVTEAERKRYDRLKNKEDVDQTPEDLKFIQEIVPRLVNSHTVPDAPFKKNWHELALKRAIREAAENGYERLSWTPGEAQAARYDLSKQVSKVYLSNPVWHGDNNIRGHLIATGKNGVDLVSKSVKDIGEIEALIGKEAADKLVNNPSSMQGRDHVLDGEGLKVGGEGMKGFYDNIVPKTIEKLGKQFGVKVQKQKLPSKTNLTIEKDLDGTYAVMDDANRVHRSFRTEKEAQSWINERNPSNEVYYIDIPPAMRDKVLAEGFPLFSANVPVIDNDQAR